MVMEQRSTRLVVSMVAMPGAILLLRPRLLTLGALLLPTPMELTLGAMLLLARLLTPGLLLPLGRQFFWISFERGWSGPICIETRSLRLITVSDFLSFFKIAHIMECN
jgi:hypothetical protein